MTQSIARTSDKGFNIFLYAFMLITLIMVLIPFLYVLFTSFSTKSEIISRGFYIIPNVWSIEAYGYLIANHRFLNAFSNAVEITVAGTLINMVVTSLMAYGLSKSWLPGRRVLNFLVVFTMLFQGGIIPTFLVVKSLGLLDSYTGLYLVGAVASFYLIVLRSFFQNVPHELEESARIDGCSELRLFISIVLPLSKAAIATITLFYAVLNWNMYFNAILYLHDSDKWPLQVFLRQMLTDNGTMEQDLSEYEYGPHVKMAAIIITALPLVMVYPFLQKYFNQGMLLGSVKG